MLNCRTGEDESVVKNFFVTYFNEASKVFALFGFWFCKLLIFGKIDASSCFGSV